MADEPKSAPPPCDRCKGPLELLTRLPPLEERPPYLIFKCTLCGFVDWIAEQAEK